MKMCDSCESWPALSCECIRSGSASEFELVMMRVLPLHTNPALLCSTVTLPQLLSLFYVSLSHCLSLSLFSVPLSLTLSLSTSFSLSLSLSLSHYTSLSHSLPLLVFFMVGGVFVKKVPIHYKEREQLSEQKSGWEHFMPETHVSKGLLSLSECLHAV